MGTHKTPTVPFTIPMFSAFIARWKELAEENTIWYGIIQPGLKKLQEYEQELKKAPAHILAMGTYVEYFYFIMNSHSFSC
jgi:hypothetical protein